MFFNLKYCSNNDWFNYEPDEIFHFTKLSSFENIMKSNALRFRKNNYSNDDRDGKIHDYILSAINSTATYKFITNPAWDEFSKRIESFFKLYEQLNLTVKSKHTIKSLPTMYNICFSTGNSDHMWSKYGDFDKGVAIGFSKSILKRFLDYPFSNNENKYFDCTCGKIIYDEETKNKIIEDIIINSFKEYCSLKQDLKSDCFNETLIELLICSYFFKDEKWNLENEFRFVLIHTKDLISPEIDENENLYIQLNFNNSDDFKKYAITRLNVKCESYLKSLSKFNINIILT